MISTAVNKVWAETKRKTELVSLSSDYSQNSVRVQIQSDLQSRSVSERKEKLLTALSCTEEM